MPDPSEHVPDTYEVLGGKLHHITGRGRRETLTAGRRFHPTFRQVRGGALRGKARKVKDAPSRAATTVSKDVGLRTLEWGSPHALRMALAAQPVLTVEEMEAAGATGATGYVTDDVRRALDARRE